MPSRKRRRTPPPATPAPAPAPAPAAPAAVSAPAHTPPLRETFDRRHVVAIVLVALASVPALLEAFWDAPASSNAVVVPAVIALTLGALILNREQWIQYPRRQMLLTLGFGALAALTAPAAPLGLLLPTLFAAVLEFKRGWGAASALVLGAGVAYALFGIEPSTSYPYVVGMAWPAIGANIMRRSALAGSGHPEATVLRRGRW